MGMGQDGIAVVIGLGLVRMEKVRDSVDAARLDGVDHLPLEYERETPVEFFLVGRRDTATTRRSKYKYNMFGYESFVS
jgi:hypothetical protein